MRSSTSRPVRLLGLSGSLRQGSHCTAVLETLQDKLEGTVEMAVFPLHDVPLYNQDLDKDNPPKAVVALRRA